MIINLLVLMHSLPSKFKMGSRYVVERTITVCYCGNHVGSEALASLLLRGVKEEEMPVSLHVLV